MAKVKRRQKALLANAYQPDIPKCFPISISAFSSSFGSCNLNFFLDVPQTDTVMIQINEHQSPPLDLSRIIRPSMIASRKTALHIDQLAKYHCSLSLAHNEWSLLLLYDPYIYMLCIRVSSTHYPYIRAVCKVWLDCRTYGSTYGPYVRLQAVHTGRMYGQYR